MLSTDPPPASRRSFVCPPRPSFPPYPQQPRTQEEKQSFDRDVVWGGVTFIAFIAVAFFVTIGLDVSYMVMGGLG